MQAQQGSTELVDPEIAAAYLGVREQTLSAWRSTKRYDIPYVKVGRLVKYRREDLDRFIASRTVNAEIRTAA